jgi:hypothetical protein
MKILFLDIDGVVVTSRSHVALGKGSLMLSPDPIALGLVDRLCRETGAKIVLSSTWGPVYGAGAMRMWLTGHGVNPNHLFAEEHFLTPRNYLRSRRGQEVADWLEEARERSQVIEAHVAIDDDGDFADKSRLVQTLFDDGLSYSDYGRALELLGGKQ